MNMCAAEPFYMHENQCTQILNLLSPADGRKPDWFSHKLFSCRYSNILLYRIFSKTLPNVGNKETGL